MRLIQSQFRTWLKTKAPDEIVGESRDNWGCPLACFYSDTTGDNVSISSNGAWYFIDRGYAKRTVPAWAEDFILGVDESDSAQITAAHALEILGG